MTEYVFQWLVRYPWKLLRRARSAGATNRVSGHAGRNLPGPPWPEQNICAPAYSDKCLNTIVFLQRQNAPCLNNLYMMATARSLTAAR